MNNKDITSALSWIEFSNEVLKDSRPMTPEEHKATDEFFLSQFEDTSQEYIEATNDNFCELLGNVSPKDLKKCNLIPVVKKE